MALSDTCSDALLLMQEDFVDYADWGYNPAALSRIVAAMYELATFMVNQDSAEIPEDGKLIDIIDSTVVYKMIEFAHAAERTDICLVLANVSNFNNRLFSSIDRLIESLSKKERMLDVIKAPYLLEYLLEIKRLQNV